MLKKVFGLFMTIVAVLPAFGQSQANLNSSIPADPNVKIGKLENGLVYYIRKNAKPEKRVMLQLATNAGSINETADQVGLAHFCEHMMFNGTKNFPKNELINFLQSTGVRFGGDINAYTSFDETVYMLEIPTDKVGLLDKGYQVLEDWAHLATFDGAEIDRERGVIIEEWRMGLGADDRMRKKTFPIILGNSLYANRLPIGTIENLKGFKHESIRKFYKDYYRPNLQAVIVVGDINIADAEAKIKKHFGGIKNPENAPERKYAQIPDNVQPIVAIATDKEATSNSVAIMYKHPQKPILTEQDYRNYILNELASEMLNARLAEITQEPNSPFMYAAQGMGSFLRNVDAYQVFAVTKEGEIGTSFKTLLEECYRIERHGFLESELNRAKESFLAVYEKAASEADKTPSTQLASEYVQNFLTRMPIPGSVYELNLVRKLLPNITIEEVSKMAQQGISEENMIVLVNAPEKAGVKVPSEAEILKILSNAKNDTTIPQYVDNYKEEPLVQLPVKAASGAKVVAKDELNGITTVKLSNGITIALKPTKFQNDEILFSAYNLGGISLVDIKDFMSASMAGSIIAKSGLGAFDNTELSKKLKGKTISYDAGLSGLQASISGSSSIKDLETLLQLNYLTFTAPRKDGKACQSFVSKLKNQSKLMKASPVYTFIDSLMKVASNYDPRVVVLPSSGQIASIDSSRVFDIFKSNFSNAGSFHFYMVGNFNINDTLLSLLETYMGSLPAKEDVRNWVDVSMPPLDKKIDFNVVKGSDDQGMVGIVFNIPMEWDVNTRKALSFFSSVMEIKLTEVIREEMGGVYSPSVNIQMERYPKATSTFTVMFGCDPLRADELTNAVIEQINLLIKNGPSDADMVKVKETMKRSLEKNLQENEFWIHAMENADFIGSDINLVNQEAQNKIIDGMTAKIIKKILKSHINPSMYVRCVLLPEPTE